MNKKKILIGGIVAAIIAALAIIFVQSAANAEGDEPCVPSDAWTETIEHPAVTHVVHHEEVTHTVHIIDVEAVPGQHYSLKGNSGIDTDETPVFPAEYWQANTEQEPHDNGAGDPVTWLGTPGQGLHYASHGSSGKRDWFYYTAPVAEISHDEVIVDQQAYDETVVDEEAWTEVIEHPAVTCEGDQPDPLVQEASSTSYECGDDTQTTTHTVTTTEWVLVEGEWVLGEPVTETSTTTENVEVVPCDTPEEPQEPNEPNQPVKHQLRNVSVPTVIDAGL